MYSNFITDNFKNLTALKDIRIHIVTVKHVVADVTYKGALNVIIMFAGVNFQRRLRRGGAGGMYAYS